MRPINFIFIRLAVCAAIMFGLLARPSSVSACSCETGITLPQYFVEYDAVFSGKVLRIVDNYYPIFSTLDNILSKFGSFPYFFHESGRYWGYSVFMRTIDSWKGADKTIIEVDTGNGMGDCGYTFEIGKEYLIYASHAYGIPDNYWVTDTCARNAQLTHATEDLTYLRTFPSLPLKSTLPIMWTEKDVIYGAPFILVGIITLVIRLRKSKK